MSHGSLLAKTGRYHLLASTSFPSNSSSNTSFQPAFLGSKVFSKGTSSAGSGAGAAALRPSTLAYPTTANDAVKARSTAPENTVFILFFRELEVYADEHQLRAQQHGDDMAALLEGDLGL